MKRINEIREKAESFNNVKLTEGYNSSNIYSFSVVGTSYAIDGIVNALKNEKDIELNRVFIGGRDTITISINK